MAKATKAEHEARVTEVYGFLIRGASRAMILRHAAEKWGLKTRQTETYIGLARERFARLAETVRDEEFGRALEQLNDLYQKSLTGKDYSNCLKVRQELSEHLGLYPEKGRKSDTTTQVFLGSPAWAFVKQRLLDVLSRHPAALADVAREFGALQAAALPSATDGE